MVCAKNYKTMSIFVKVMPKMNIFSRHVYTIPYILLITILYVINLPNFDLLH